MLMDETERLFKVPFEVGNVLRSRQQDSATLALTEQEAVRDHPGYNQNGCLGDAVAMEVI